VAPHGLRKRSRNEGWGTEDGLDDLFSFSHFFKKKKEKKKKKTFL
jgi:hypothetical protein